MGNKPIKIGVRLDKDVCEAGEVLSGRVYLSVTSGQNQQSSGVTLTICGEELATIVREEEGDRDQRRKEITRASSILVNMNVPLASFPSGVIPPGQYEYPFEWPIPDRLPSSMRCVYGDSHCEVRYRVTASLNNSGTLLVGKDYSCHADVMLLAKSFETSRQEVQMDPEPFPIKTCCFNRGSVKLGWDVDRTVAAPHETVKVVIVGRNESIVSVQYLNATWEESVQWNAHGRTIRSRRPLAEAKIYAADLINWRPLMQLPSREQMRDWNSYESLSELIRLPTQLQIPMDAKDTYAGQLITVRHMLTVKAVTPGACCITNPESSTMVRIQRRAPGPSFHSTTPTAMASPVAATAAVVVAPDEPPMAMAQVLPPDWTPQEAKVVVIQAQNISTTPQPTAPPAASLETSDVVVLPTAPPEDLLRESHDIATNLSLLQASLTSSQNPSGTLGQILRNNSRAVAAIKNLSPHEFVETIKVCHTQQPGVARQLAMTMSPNFYCRHIMAALWGLSQHARFQVLKEIAPLASDLDTQRAVVERELDPTELQYFRAALKK